MNKIVIVLVVALEVAGCASTTASRAALPPVGYHSLGDPTLEPQDARAITVAHEYVEKKAGKTVEAYYCPRKTETGYLVDVNFIIGDSGRGSRLTGPISAVKISGDWQKIEYIRW